MASLFTSDLKALKILHSSGGAELTPKFRFTTIKCFCTTINIFDWSYWESRLVSYVIVSRLAQWEGLHLDFWGYSFVESDLYILVMLCDKIVISQEFSNWANWGKKKTTGLPLSEFKMPETLVKAANLALAFLHMLLLWY